MAKDTSYYFGHDYNARSDAKIKTLLSKHGMLGYGIYWAIIEDLYNNANEMRTHYESIAYDLRADENVIKSIVNDFDLFVFNGDFFGSLAVQRRLDEWKTKSVKASNSARIRWQNMRAHSEYDANALPSQSDSNAIKERKGKKKKETIPPAEVVLSITQKFIAEYNVFLTAHTGGTELFEIAGRAGLKKIIDYLRSQVKAKHPGLTQDKEDEWTLDAWKYILSGYEHWDPYHQKNLKLSQIYSNLINIMAACKQKKPHGKQSPQQLAGEVATLLTHQQNG